MTDLLQKVRQGNTRAIARLITTVENDEAEAQETTAVLHAGTGNAYVIGVTGPPGCGKSTLVNELAKAFNDRGKSVGIIAVDPSSPFSGGAILGDRVRMGDIATRDGIFVRSMASRGTLGGLATATSTAVKILDVAGYDLILVETVGAGQAEVDIASAAHTVLVIEAPGSGDEVQSIKAGILEIADILVVNKADRPSALNTVRALEMMLHLGTPSVDQHHGPETMGDLAPAEELASEDRWDVPVLQTVATEGTGIGALLAAVESHHAYLIESGEWFAREVRRSRREIERLLQNQVLTRIKGAVTQEQRERLIAAVANREMDPYQAANQLLSVINGHLPG